MSPDPIAPPVAGSDAAVPPPPPPADEGDASTPPSPSTARSAWRLDRQKVMVGVVLIVVLVGGWLLFRGSGSSTPVPSSTSTPSTSVSANPVPASATMLEDLKYVAERFPHLQLHAEAFTVSVEVLGPQATADLLAGAKKVFDGARIEVEGDVKLERATILLDETNSRIEGFNAVVSGTLKGGKAFKQNVYIEDGTWTAERSAKFARELRSEVKKVRIYSPSAGGSEHRVRLDVQVPRSVPVSD